MGRAKIKAPDTFFLPYQARWIKDRSRLKLMEKSRQIGISWSTAYRVVEITAMRDNQHDRWVSSRDDLQAKLFLEDCKAWAKVLNTVCKDLGERVIDEEKKFSAYVAEFPNGKRIHSMSSNPDAQAGKRGGRVLDEFALHADPRKLWSIAYPGITWGGEMEIISTHRGSANFFVELIKEIKEEGNPKKISLHTVTLQTALDQGFLDKLQQKLPDDGELQEMDESDYFDFKRSGCADEESFLQEFCCVPADDNSAFLSYDLIASCELPASDYVAGTEETRDYIGRKGRIRRLTSKEWSPINGQFPLYLGLDVGRKKDLTVMWLCERVANVLFLRKLIEMESVEWDRQATELVELLKLPRMTRACVDASGMGHQLGEQMQKRFGAGRVEMVTFSGPVKEQLAYPVRGAMEDRNLRYPNDKHIRADFRGIKKTTTPSGNIRFEGERTADGHSDRFWAAALCVHAAASITGSFRYQPVERRGHVARGRQMVF